jgi:5-methylcytosine-specific restriction endonuclease McrA
MARKLLSSGKAAVFRRVPFVIILKEAVERVETPELRLKVDPGSKTTGIAVVNQTSGQVAFALELTHRGQAIKDALDSRRAIRRSRRNRKTRYRKPRFLNRTRPKGWLAPSLEHRVLTTITWVRRLTKAYPISALSQELVRFDMQLMENPEISGVLYQQGELVGYEVREYLLEKWGRKCAYCGKKDTPLEVEHIVPKSRGGSDRISNLTLACTPCNQAKDNQTAAEFGFPEIQSRAKAPLKDAAAVNATRWKLYEELKAFGLPVETGSGGLTKYNRCTRNLPKSHWLDAACVGKSTPEVLITEGVKPLEIKAMGHNSRQMRNVDKYGFPKGKPKGARTFNGFRTGDMVKAVVTKGVKVGSYTGRISIRSTGSFKLTTTSSTVDGIGHKYCRIIHRSDGYSTTVNRAAARSQNSSPR